MLNISANLCLTYDIRDFIDSFLLHQLSDIHLF